jgi:hypothetical protein
MPWSATRPGGWADDGSTPHLVRASDIEPVQVSWLWQSWLPVGKLVLLEGDPGCGRSSIAIDLAARLTSGSPMPTGEEIDPAGVVILNAEDGLDDTVRQRLKSNGASATRGVRPESAPSPPRAASGSRSLTSALSGNMMNSDQSLRPSSRQRFQAMAPDNHPIPDGLSIRPNTCRINLFELI